MATSAQVLFIHEDSKIPIAALSFFNDGSPKHMLPFLNGFFEAVQQNSPNDTRFDDSSYLAARLVTYFALLKHQERPLDHILQVRGVGVLNSELRTPAAYAYVIISNSNGVPTVKWKNSPYATYPGIADKKILADPAWRDPSGPNQD